MTFIFPALLGGLTLLAIPVLLHLIMQQKPKQLLFPAFRFLMQRHKTNQRRLRLRHFLLLAMRLLLIAAACFALARPKIFSSRLNLSNGRTIAAVLIFDTSFSMGYVSGGKSRDEQAKRRALELIDEVSENSKLAILDSAEPGGEWLPIPLARERIESLHLRPNNGPVTGRMAEAYRMLGDLDQEVETSDEALPKFIYIFSDRTQESWDQSRVRDIAGGLEVHSKQTLLSILISKVCDMSPRLMLILSQTQNTGVWFFCH